MIALTRLADYAVVVLSELAQPGLQLSAAEVALRSGLPSPTVSKILKLLGRAGIVSATRGVGGGYRLARSATELPLLEVIEAMDGPVALTHCSLGSSGCPRAGHCRVEPGWSPIQQALRASLARVTLAEMWAAPAADAPRTAPARPRVKPHAGPGRRALSRWVEEG